MRSRWTGCGWPTRGGQFQGATRTLDHRREALCRSEVFRIRLRSDMGNSLLESGPSFLWPRLQLRVPSRLLWDDSCRLGSRCEKQILEIKTKIRLR
jgi:hypothetical protein